MASSACCLKRKQYSVQENARAWTYRDLGAWTLRESRQRRVGVIVALVAVTDARGVPRVELTVTVGLDDASNVGVGVDVSRVGIRPWVGVRGTVPLGRGRIANVAVSVGRGGSVT